MRRTSIQNKLILYFLILILIVMVVVVIVSLFTDKTYLAQGISTAIALAMGTLFGSFFSKSIVGRLNSLSGVAEKVSNGDLTRDIEIVSKDEIQNLEKSFSAMLHHLRSMLTGIHRVFTEVQEANVNLGRLTHKVLESSKKIDQSAQEIAIGSEAQSRIVQKTSLKVEEGVETLNTLMRQSAQTVSKINNAIRKTEKGERIARETLLHLEKVLTQMVMYTQPVYKLAGKVEKIKVIINVMESIAQKTDLLSLNASIEATRAGDYGKGFALVAEEIRGMADSSKQSSHEITELIEDILADNKEVSGFLAKNQADVDSGHKIIRNIVETFGDMMTGVQEIFAEVTEIEKTTSRQVSKMRGIPQYFDKLSTLADKSFLATQKTTVATGQQSRDVARIAEAMDTLNKLNEKMIATQQHFKLPERPT